MRITFNYFKAAFVRILQFLYIKTDDDDNNNCCLMVLMFVEISSISSCFSKKWNKAEPERRLPLQMIPNLLISVSHIQFWSKILMIDFCVKDFIVSVE